MIEHDNEFTAKISIPITKDTYCDRVSDEHDDYYLDVFTFSEESPAAAESALWDFYRAVVRAFEPRRET